MKNATLLGPPHANSPLGDVANVCRFVEKFYQEIGLDLAAPVFRLKAR